MTKDETKKEDSIEKRLVDLHPKFLETVKQVYPLGVLGSLCIAIASFTIQTYPNASTYAITAASLFFTAFAISFLFLIYPDSILALITYIATFLAIVFLFFVIFIFSSSIYMVSFSFTIILNSLFIFLFLTIIYIFYRRRKETKLSILRLLYTINIPITIIFVIYYILTVITRIINFSLPDILLTLSPYVFMLWAAIIIIIIIVTKFKK